MFFRIFIDLFAAALIAASFAYGFTGATAHEWLGLGACAALFAHNALNRRRWAHPFAGTRKARAAGTFALNVALAASLVAVAASGAMLSGELFPFVPSGEGLFARKLHTAGAAWLFVLCAFHAGLHVAFFAGAAKKILRPRRASCDVPAAGSPKKAFPRACLFALAGTVAAFGALAFFRRAFPEKLFARETFDAFTFGDALPRFLADYAAVAALFFLLGAWCSRGFRVQRAAIFS